MASDLVDAGNSPTALHSSCSNLNRRSLSIFSRRGTDTPTPATQTLAIASMSMAFANPPIAGQSNKQKRWRLSKDMKIPDGTILRMVPKDAPVAEMTPLEREMATSPNEEILRSIGMNGLDSTPVTPAQTFSPMPLADVTNTSPRRYYSTRRGRKDSQGDVIGVWRNGRAQWESLEESGQENEGRPKSAYGLGTDLENNIGTPKTDKPKIQVVIPNNPSARRPFNFVPFLSRSVSEPASKVSHIMAQDISPPSVTSGQSMDSFQISAVSPPPKTLYPERPSHAPNRSLSNSSSSGSDHEDTASQPRSSRSSMTSIGEYSSEPVIQTKQGSNRSHRGSSSSLVSFKGGDDNDHSNGEAHFDISAQPAASPIADDLDMADFMGVMRSSSMQRPKTKKRVSSSRGTLKLARIDSKEELRIAGLPSPTLSEAERSLEAQLTEFSQELISTELHPHMSSPIPEMFLSSTDALPPPPPRKSSKRRTRKALVSTPAKMSSESFSAAVEATKEARKIRQQRVDINQKAAITQSMLHRSASVRSILSQVCENEEIQPVDANAAEAVVLHILNSVQSLQDLFNTAVITKGFYKVFKAHEMQSIRQVLRTQNPAAWEYLEICRPGEKEDDDLCSAAPPEEYEPATYLRKFKADCLVVSNLKNLITVSCQNLLRNETVAQAFNESAFTCSSRMDSALWRIWSFSKIFGCGKGREDDLIAQIDWLRGGVLAHQDSCSSTISTSDSFYVSSVLLGAPDHFGKGNEGGLSAEKLYDILEVLNFLNSLAGSLLGETDQARQFGVFDDTNVEGGDIDGEEDMLEEWTQYILTLGLQPISELITKMNNDPISVFRSAQEKGWTRWTPPAIRGSRKNFLHEAVSRLYEERICEAYSPEQYRRSELRSIRRSRAPSFNSDVHHHRPRRSSAAFSVRTNASERVTTSECEGLNLNLPIDQNACEAQSSTPSTSIGRPTIVRKPVTPPTPRPHPSSYFAPTPPSQPAFPILTPQENGSWLHQPSLTTSDHLLIYPGRPTTLSRHPLQTGMQTSDSDNNLSANTAERAVFRIVEMGFTHEDAKGALKITDMGDGLRVDRAVEYLLRRTM